MSEDAEDLPQWLEAARGGSAEALGSAFEACRAYLLLIANRELDPALKAKGGASDLVQETFLEAKRDFAAFRGTSDAEWRGWLRQMLVHNLANFARHYRATGRRDFAREVPVGGDDSTRGPGAQPSAGTPSPSTAAMAHERAAAVQAALKRLPHDYCRVITLRYQDGRPFDEIATLMSRSENAVRKLWFRAVERLQQELDETT
jgi:RNA polymerase sigma-70 factor (ECF subfamily)